jgi:hypothetical protein
MKIKFNKHGGTGFQPVQSFQVTKRCLPHWQLPGSTYFITWRVKGLTGLKIIPGFLRGLRIAQVENLCHQESFQFGR